MAHVVAIHLPVRLALLSDGRSVTITTLLDVWGDETTDEKSAVSFVAGGGANGSATPCRPMRE